MTPPAWLLGAAATALVGAAALATPKAHVLIKELREQAKRAGAARCPPGTLSDGGVCIPAPLPAAPAPRRPEEALPDGLPRELSAYRVLPARKTELRPWTALPGVAGLVPRGIALCSLGAPPNAGPLRLRDEASPPTEAGRGEHWALTRHRLGASDTARTVYALQWTEPANEWLCSGFYELLPGAAFTTPAALVSEADGLALDPRIVLPLAGL